jgi:CheY-like chemotaxis protein
MLRASTAVSRRPLEDASSAEPRNARVLVIESDESARSVLEVQLKRDHFDVTLARSGAEVHRLMGAGRELPDVVVLATRLGDEDGYSLCAELRGDARTSSLPVVMLANAGEENPQALAEVVGVSQCLARPLYVRDVAIHVRLAIAPRDENGAVLLDCNDISPAYVLRAVLSASQAGRLELLGGRGVIEFADGRVLDASVDGNSGGDSMVRARSTWCHSGCCDRRAAASPPVVPDVSGRSARGELVEQALDHLAHVDQRLAIVAPGEGRVPVGLGRCCDPAGGGVDGGSQPGNVDQAGALEVGEHGGRLP